MMTERNYTPHQQRIIQRYYQNQPQILQQRLAEVVGELYLAKGKKRQQLWKRVAEMLQKIGLPQQRIEHLLTKDEPALLADIVKDLNK